MREGGIGSGGSRRPRTGRAGWSYQSYAVRLIQSIGAQRCVSAGALLALHVYPVDPIVLVYVIVVGVVVAKINGSTNYPGNYLKHDLHLIPACSIGNLVGIDRPGGAGDDG